MIFRKFHPIKLHFAYPQRCFLIGIANISPISNLSEGFFPKHLSGVVAQ